MTDDLTLTFTVPQSPDVAYAAVNDPRAWWSAGIAGITDEVGAEWTYETEGVHRTSHRVTELVPDRSAVWLTTDSWLSFIADQQEWTGTTIRFDLTPTDDGGTEVRFTHIGLVPQVECFGVCRVAWGEYVLGSLKDLIETGTGRPDSYGGEKLDEAKARAAAS